MAKPRSRLAALVVLAASSALLGIDVRAQDAVRERTSIELDAAPVRALSPRLAVALPPAIALGYDVGCVRTTSGGLQCWGENDKGQLGNGSTTDSLTPILVTMPAGVTAIDVAVAGSSSCATFSDHVVRCWGATITATGLSSTQTTPTPFPGLASVDDVEEISGGRVHMCARSSSGAVRCWGGDGTGQAGLPSTGWSDVKVVLASGARQVSAGGDHSCAVMTNGAVKCWGSNRSQQMGQRSDVDISNPPMTVPGLSNVQAVSAGPDFTCALRANHTVVCWGSNRNCQAGRTADGCPDHGAWSGNGWLASFNEIGLQDVREVATGSSHGCARLGDGGVRCWGNPNSWGIGQVSQAAGLGPAVTGIRDATSLAAHGESCAGRLNGDVYCWGASKLLYFANQTFGQAGQAFSPVRLPLLAPRRQ